jgi:hypothetical protein
MSTQVDPKAETEINSDNYYSEYRVFNALLRINYACRLGEEVVKYDRKTLLKIVQYSATWFTKVTPYFPSLQHVPELDIFVRGLRKFGKGSKIFCWFSLYFATAAILNDCSKLVMGAIFSRHFLKRTDNEKLKGLKEKVLTDKDTESTDYHKYRKETLKILIFVTLMHIGDFTNAIGDCGDWLISNKIVVAVATPFHFLTGAGLMIGMITRIWENACQIRTISRESSELKCLKISLEVSKFIRNFSLFVLSIFILIATFFGFLSPTLMLSITTISLITYIVIPTLDTLTKDWGKLMSLTSTPPAPPNKETT